MCLDVVCMLNLLGLRVSALSVRFGKMACDERFFEGCGCPVFVWTLEKLP